jgi:hypothetical protein
MSWVNGNPCANLDQLEWPESITPSFDKQRFCENFQASAQAVWSHFLTDQTDGFQHNQATFYTDCGFSKDSTPDANQINACIIQHIVGYNSKVLGGELPGQVQALLRGVAYNAHDGQPQYQFDPFLTFDTPFTSQFSLDPYTRLIHSTQDGISAVAYSFSIDDKYGNFRDASSGFTVDAGGTTALLNKQPFDPYQQYSLNWGFNQGAPAVGNWVSASICGVDIQMSGPGSQRLPLSLDDGAYRNCPIKVTDSFGGTLALELTPSARRAVDTYTGATVSVFGMPVGPTFSGDPLVTSNLSGDDLQSCQSASSLPDLCANVTLSAVWSADPLARDVVYMGLDPKDMPRVNVNLPAAPLAPPDAHRVTWPASAKITTHPQDDGSVLVSWPAAQVGDGARLQYLLYVKNGADWDPAPGCDQYATSCAARLAPNAAMYVIALNNSVSPPSQTPQLFGSYSN